MAHKQQLQPQQHRPSRNWFLFSALHVASDYEQEEGVECSVGQTLLAVPKSFSSQAFPKPQQQHVSSPPPPLPATPIPALAPLLLATRQNDKLALFHKCLTPMKLMVGEPPEDVVSKKQWKRKRMEMIASLPAEPAAATLLVHGPSDFVEACLMEGTLQGSLLCVLLLLEYPPQVVCALQAQTCSLLASGTQQTAATCEALAARILARVAEQCSVFAATLCTTTGAKKSEAAFAPRNAFKAHPMTFLMLHALLIKALAPGTCELVLPLVCRILSLQFWYAELAEISPSELGLIQSCAENEHEQQQQQLAAQMNAQNVGGDIAQLLMQSRSDECALAWISGLALLYPMEQDRLAVFHSLLLPANESLVDAPEIFLECICARICQAPTKFAPSLLREAQHRLAVCSRLLDSIQEAPGRDRAVPATGATHWPTSPTSSIGGHSAFSTARHESDEEDDRCSVSSLTGQSKTRSVSSMTSSLAALDTKSEPGTAGAPPPLLLPVTSKEFELLRPMQCASHHRTRLHSILFYLAMSGGAGSAPPASSLASSTLIFNEPRVAETIEIMDHGTKAVQKADKKWGTAISLANCSANADQDGIFRWRIRVNKCDDGHVFFGIATREAISSGFLGEDGHGWGFLGKANLWHAREKKQSHYGEPIRTGDTVVITMDCKRGTLSFGNQRKDFGVAFRNIPQDVFPAVALYERGDCVTLAADDVPGTSAEEDVCRMMWNVLDGTSANLLERKLGVADHYFSALNASQADAVLMAHCKRVIQAAQLPALSALCLWPQMSPAVALDLLPNALAALQQHGQGDVGLARVDVNGLWCFSDSSSKHSVEIQVGAAGGEVSGFLLSKREGQVRIAGEFDGETNTLMFIEHWKSFTRRVQVQLMAGGGMVGLGWCRIESKTQPTQLAKNMTCFKLTNRHAPNTAGAIQAAYANLTGKLILALTQKSQQEEPAREIVSKWANSFLFARFPVKHDPRTPPWLDSAFLKQVCASELEVFLAAQSSGSDVEGSNSSNDSFVSSLLAAPLAQTEPLDHYMLRFAGQAALAAIGGEVVTNLRRHVIACLLHMSPQSAALVDEARTLQKSLLESAASPPTTLERQPQPSSAEDLLEALCPDEEYNALEDPLLASMTRPSTVASLVAAPPPMPPPSQALVTIWRAATRAVSWVVREKQQRQEPYQAICHPIIARAKFLLRCEPLPIASRSLEGDDYVLEQALAFCLQSSGDSRQQEKVEEDLVLLEKVWSRRAAHALLKCCGLKAMTQALDYVSGKHLSSLLAWLGADALREQNHSVAPKPATNALIRLDFEETELLPPKPRPKAAAATSPAAASHCLVGLENCGQDMSRQVMASSAALFGKLVELLQEDEDQSALERNALLRATSLFPVLSLEDCDLVRIALPKWKKFKAFGALDALTKQLVRLLPHSHELLQDLVSFSLSLSKTDVFFFSQAVQLLFEINHPNLVANWEWMDTLIGFSYEDARTCHRGFRVAARTLLTLPARRESVLQLFSLVQESRNPVAVSESIAILQGLFVQGGAEWRALVEAELESGLGAALPRALTSIQVLGGYLEPLRFGAKVWRTRHGKREQGLVDEDSTLATVSVRFVMDRDEEEEVEENQAAECEFTLPQAVNRHEVFPHPTPLLLLTPSLRALLLPLLDQALVKKEEEDSEADGISPALRVGLARLLPALLPLQDSDARMASLARVAIGATETLGTLQDEHLAAMYFQALQVALAKEPALLVGASTSTPPLPPAIAGSLESPSASPGLEDNPILEELMSLDMGFPRELCQVALDHAHNDIEQAIHFCLENAHQTEQIVAEYRQARWRNSSVAVAAAAAEQQANEALAADALAIVDRLAEMGFPRTWCLKGVEQVLNRNQGGAAAAGRDLQSVFNLALHWILSNGDALQEQDLLVAQQQKGEAALLSPAATTTAALEEQPHHHVKLVVNSGGISSTQISSDYSVSCTPFNRQTEGGGTFPTVTAAGMAPLRSGRWYYEVTLQSDNCMQIGWCDAMFTGDAFEGNGTGDCAHSWSYDGYRKIKWHNAQQQAWGRAWRTGSVIGCFADLDRGELWFSMDGDWCEGGMGLAFKGLRVDKTCIRGLRPSISFNRTERFRVNFGPEFQYDMCPPNRKDEDCSPVSSASSAEEGDFFEELVGDALCNRYFAASASAAAQQQPHGSSGLQTVLLARRSNNTTTTNNAASLGGTPPVSSNSPPPPALAPLALLPSRELPFPSACTFKKRSISSLSQALEELSSASKEDLNLALKRTSWTLFVLQTRRALRAHLASIPPSPPGEEKDDGTVLWRLCRYHLALCANEAEEDALAVAARQCLREQQQQREALLAQCALELGKITRREYAQVPWDDSLACSMLVVHSFWTMVCDDFTHALNEIQLTQHPSLRFALWATNKLLLPFGLDNKTARHELIALWAPVLHSPSTALKQVACQVLVGLVKCAQDVEAFEQSSRGISTARVSQMASRLIARGGVISLQAVHSKYAMALSELAAALSSF